MLQIEEYDEPAQNVTVAVEVESSKADITQKSHTYKDKYVPDKSTKARRSNQQSDTHAKQEPAGEKAKSSDASSSESSKDSPRSRRDQESKGHDRSGTERSIRGEEATVRPSQEADEPPEEEDYEDDFEDKDTFNEISEKILDEQTEGKKDGEEETDKDGAGKVEGGPGSDGGHDSDQEHEKTEANMAELTDEEREAGKPEKVDTRPSIEVDSSDDDDDGGRKAKKGDWPLLSTGVPP